MISIGLRSEYILKIFGLGITNSFLTTLLVTLLIGFFAMFFYFSYGKKNPVTETLRAIVYELLKLTDVVTRDRQLSKKVIPIISTFFVFIISSNLLALMPGFLGSFYIKTSDAEVLPLLRSPNSDLTTTLALSIFSVLSIQYFSIKFLGLKGYLKKFFNLKGPIELILGFFDVLNEAVKVLSFSMRLFGNIFAGEILLLVIAFLIPYFIPVPFMILEVFVGIIQAFIFAILTLTFIKTSIITYMPEKSVNQKEVFNN